MGTTIGGLNYLISANTSGFTKGVLATRAELAATKRVMQETMTPAQQLGTSIDTLRGLFHKELITLEQLHEMEKKVRDSTPEAIAQRKQQAEAEALLQAKREKAAAIVDRNFSAEQRYARSVAELDDLKQHAGLTEEAYVAELRQLQRTLPAVIDAERRAAQQQRELNDVMRRGAAITSELRNPTERYRDRVLELRTAADRGAISQETLARGLRAAKLEKMAGIPVIGRFASQLQSVHPAAIAAGMGIAAATAGIVIGRRAVMAFVDAISEQLDIIDQLAKSGGTVGLSAQSMRELGFAAKEAGVEQAVLDEGFRKMNKSIADAAAGTGPASAVLKELSIDAKELQQLGPHKAFELLADRIAGIADPMDRARVAQAIFSEGGVKLMNVFAGGRDGLQASADDLRDLTGSLSELDSANVEAANDAMGRVKLTLSDIATDAAVSLGPALKLIADDLIQLTKEGSSFGSAMRTGVDLLGPSLAFVGDKTNMLIGMFQEAQAQVISLMASLLSNAATVDSVLAALTGNDAEPALAIMADSMTRAADDLHREAAKRFDDGLAGKMADDYDRMRNSAVEASDAMGDTLAMTQAAAEAAAKEAEAREKIEELGAKALDDLRLQVALFGLSAEEAERMKLAFEGVDDTTLAMIKETQETLAAMKVDADLDKAVTDLTDKLREQAVTMGMSSDEIEMFKLAQQGATEEQLAGARAAKDARDRMKDFRDAMAEGAKIAEQFKSPAQKAADELDHLQSLFDQGAITEDVFAQATKKLRDELAPPIVTTFETKGLDSAVEGSKAFAEAFAAQRDAAAQANSTTIDVGTAQAAADRGQPLAEALANRADPQATAEAANRDVLERIAEILESIESKTEPGEPLEVEEVTL